MVSFDADCNEERSACANFLHNGNVFINSEGYSKLDSTICVSF